MTRTLPVGTSADISGTVVNAGPTDYTEHLTLSLNQGPKPTRHHGELRRGIKRWEKQQETQSCTANTDAKPNFQEAVWHTTPQDLE